MNIESLKEIAAILPITQASQVPRDIILTIQQFYQRWQQQPPNELPLKSDLGFLYIFREPTIIDEQLHLFCGIDIIPRLRQPFLADAVYPVKIPISLPNTMANVVLNIDMCTIKDVTPSNCFYLFHRWAYGAQTAFNVALLFNISEFGMDEILCQNTYVYSELTMRIHSNYTEATVHLLAEALISTCRHEFSII